MESRKSGLKSVMKDRTLASEVESVDGDGSRGSLMSKLEKMSGIWSDLDSAPVVIETQRDIKKQEERLPLSKQNTVINKWNDSDDAYKKEIDNRKRIQSLQQRSETLKVQHNVINSALTFDKSSQMNRRIVFGEDTEGPQETNSKKQLIDSKKVEDISSKSGLQFNDASGYKLQEQQSHYGIGNLNKLDDCFGESRKDLADENIVDSREKDNQLAILSSLIHLPANNLQNLESEKNQLKSKAFVRFDPNVKDHVKFEKANSNSASKLWKKEKIGPESQSLPEVSSERYYQTTKALDIGKGGEFSLRNLFKQSQDTFQEEEEEEKEFTSRNRCGMAQEVVSETYFKSEIVGKSEQQSYWKNAGMWHEPLFFLSGDVRFKESMDFIHRAAKDESYQDRNKWSEQREKLKQFYRNKMRRHSQWVTESSQQPQKKRPLTDAADESSYNFYGQQDEIERQKKKKPHRPFFK